MTICEHLKPGSYPFKLELLLDSELTFTDALLRCRCCQQLYLLELLDQRGPRQLFRISMPDAQQGQLLLHNLRRGSCDLQRAKAELLSLQSVSPFLPWLLLLDSNTPVIIALVSLQGFRPPPGSWRTLPCDGSWFDQTRV